MKKELNFGRNVKMPLKVAILIMFASFCMVSCNLQVPRLTPDVLEVNQVVRINPVGTIKWVDGDPVISLSTGNKDESYFIVNKEFMAWVFELKEEIKRLRQ